MDKKVAEFLVKKAYASAKELLDLVPFLELHCEREVYEEYKSAIGKVSGDVLMEIVYRTYSKYPEIEAEVDESIKKYGRVL